jgi:hypothetical protein
MRVSTFTAGIVAAGLLAAPLAVAAQTSSPPAQAAPDTSVSNDTLTKAGKALRDVAKIQDNYEGKIEAAPTQEQKQGLSSQASAEAVQAINSKGLSVQEYNRVIQIARANPTVKQKLLNAAGLSQ